MIKQLAGVAVLAALAASAGAQQDAQKGSAERARDKVSMCVGCHGIPDYRTAYPSVYRVPLIAGQSADYITAALNAYRNGDRPHPSMQGIAKGLSDQDIADLAAYYSTATGGAPR